MNYVALYWLTAAGFAIAQVFAIGIWIGRHRNEPRWFDDDIFGVRILFALFGSAAWPLGLPLALGLLIGKPKKKDMK